ncbi:MAG: hypothetical protein PUC30_02545 [Lachnospiraceae bacterium]|nr:hypothetical protein [Lachnospiraceae bacterium]
MNFLIYGEDCRHAILSNLLIEAGYVMQAPADLLILSPKESFSAHTDVINKNCLVWGGKATESDVLQKAGCRKIKQRDSFRVRNSVFTAEGALALAISESKTALCESSVFVLGYGYLGKACTRLFTAAGADVTVYTEKPSELLQAVQAGYRADKLTGLSRLDHVILLNTIPCPVLDSLPVFITASPALLIELASIPCTTGEIKGLRIIPAGALPSRFSPESAAKLMFDEIIYQSKKE